MIGKLEAAATCSSEKQPRSVRLSLARGATLKLQDFVHERHAFGFQDRGGRPDCNRPDG